jgi:hypothetical protein
MDKIIAPRPQISWRRGALLVFVVALSLGSFGASSAFGGGPAAVAHRHRPPRHEHTPRVGGHVTRAWPQVGRAPKTALDRWLAHQVGASKPRACAKQWRQARRRCHIRHAALGSGSASQRNMLSLVAGDPGTRPGPLAELTPSELQRSIAHADAATSLSLPLELVRSYNIPVDDPSYNSLLNWSWTYDSTVSAAAFAASGDRGNAQELLSQLAALQHTDGSIEIAFNTATGVSVPTFRSGTVAWVGLAAATYDKAFSTSQFLNMEELAANYLLSLQNSHGLIAGGPDVSWISTQHNLIAYVFLSRLAAELQGDGKPTLAATYESAATAVSAAINANLLVTNSTGTHFLEGVNDTTQALDVQAIGAMYLAGIGQTTLASQVLAYLQSTFAVSGRSVRQSSNRATYNMTYAAAGPFSGYEPYSGAGAPDVLWAEGAPQVELAQAAIGLSTSATDGAISNWAAITSPLGQGPLQADNTVTNSSFGVQYHVWPASTAAAWTVLARSAPSFFAAPLPPATSVITGWTAVRGGNLISILPTGEVDMNNGAGERRVLAGSATATDYTVTSTATLLSGAGYGVYVRASDNSSQQVTGYCVQVDHGYASGELIVRANQNDYEVPTPVAAFPLPSGFAWYGTQHTISVTVIGDTMAVSLDGTPDITIPSLTAAVATAAKYASTTITPPTAGGYGLRSWSDGMVTFPQTTFTPLP